MSFLSPYVEKDGVKKAFYTLKRGRGVFNITDFTRSYNLSASKSTFGRLFYNFGDRSAEQPKVKLRGTITGSSETDFYEAQDYFFELLDRGEQWLVFGKRRILFNGITGDKKSYEDLADNKAHVFEVDLNLVKSYWESNDVSRLETSLTGAPFLFTLLNLGNLPFWPVFKVTVEDTEAVEFRSGNRIFYWRNIGNEGGVSLLSTVTTFNGVLTFDFSNARYSRQNKNGDVLEAPIIVNSELRPGSQTFPINKPGSDVLVSLIGANPTGTLVTEYRQCYYSN